jgi:hypothetical protein
MDKTKPIRQVKNAVSLVSNSRANLVNELEWNNVLARPPLSNYKTAKRNYVDPIVKMCHKLKIPSDKFYSSKLRERSNDIKKYWLETYCYNTAV